MHNIQCIQSNRINITLIEQICHLLRISKHVYIYIHKHLISKLTCLLNKISIHRAANDAIAREKIIRKNVINFFHSKIRKSNLKIYHIYS